jgi:uncharacterized protein YcfJ
VIGYYLLVGRDPVACDDPLAWARWFEKADRRVARTDIGDVAISTVFLGINHGSAFGRPLLFETMAFGGAFDGNCVRSSCWDEAEYLHASAVALVTSGVPRLEDNGT